MAEAEAYQISNQFFEFLTLVVTEVIPFVLRLDQLEGDQVLRT